MPRHTTELCVLLVIFILGTVIIKIKQSEKPKYRDIKAFVNSAYYYPKSESLGDNAVAIVMSMNLVTNKDFYFENQDPDAQNPEEVTILAINSTASITVKAPIQKISILKDCQIIGVFATAQLIPNVKSISMVSDDGVTKIPFSTPSYKKRDVVVCTSPLFVNEQWQNFLFAVHIYKKYGAFVNLYVISAVKSYFQLMKEYEKADYLTIQPWVSVKFPEVSPFLTNAFEQVDFRNQAAAQSDCLLQYKETAKFITFLDMDDVLIPKIAPTFVEEFQAIFSKSEKKLAYLTYHKQNFGVVTVRDGVKFSIKEMFGTLKNLHGRETGKQVIDPKNLNFTWIHYPPVMPQGMDKYEVTENAITHLKKIRWTTKSPPLLNMTSDSESILSPETLQEIEEDFQKMTKPSIIRNILRDLPKRHHFGDIIGKCYGAKLYRWPLTADRVGYQKCPGPQLCSFDQHPDIECMHVKASYSPMKPLYPITYYFATHVSFADDIGCYPH